MQEFRSGLITETVNITNSIISGNASNSSVSSVFGGGMIVGSIGTTVTITGSTISHNSATSTGAGISGQGGGIYNQEATLNISDSSIIENTANAVHAGIRTVASSGGPATTTITNCTISNNTARKQRRGRS